MTPILALTNANEILLILGFLGFAAALTTFWVCALISCAKRVSAGETGLVGWLLAIALTQILGAAAYVFFGPRRGLRNAA